VKDQKHGQGVCTWPDGKKYDGGWQDNKQHGKAVLSDPLGKTQFGFWENGNLKQWLDRKKTSVNGTPQNKEIKSPTNLTRRS